jgi:hypothetical protein
MAVVLRSWGSGLVVLAAGVVVALISWSGGACGLLVVAR